MFAVTILDPCSTLFLVVVCFMVIGRSVAKAASQHPETSARIGEGLIDRLKKWLG